jgi:hypothetical protein
VVKLIWLYLGLDNYFSFKHNLMKSLVLAAAVICIAFADMQAQEFTVITSVESIIPAGIGRSRIINNKDDVNPDAFTTERTDGKHSDQGKVRRRDIKVDNFEETKLLNFYSIGGINFRNIASNDAVISAKINQMVANGWELAFVTSAVESDGG